MNHQNNTENQENVFVSPVREKAAKSLVALLGDFSSSPRADQENISSSSASQGRNRGKEEAEEAVPEKRKRIALSHVQLDDSLRRSRRTTKKSKLVAVEDNSSSLPNSSPPPPSSSSSSSSSSSHTVTRTRSDATSTKKTPSSSSTSSSSHNNSRPKTTSRVIYLGSDYDEMIVTQVTYPSDEILEATRARKYSPSLSKKPAQIHSFSEEFAKSSTPKNLLSLLCRETMSADGVINPKPLTIQPKVHMAETMEDVIAAKKKAEKYLPDRDLVVRRVVRSSSSFSRSSSSTRSRPPVVPTRLDPNFEKEIKVSVLPRSDLPRRPCVRSSLRYHFP